HQLLGPGGGSLLCEQGEDRSRLLVHRLSLPHAVTESQPLILLRKVSFRLRVSHAPRDEVVLLLPLPGLRHRSPLTKKPRSPPRLEELRGSGSWPPLPTRG